MTELNDTSKEVDDFQVQLLRKTSIARRFLKARSLSSTVIRLSRQAIHRGHPTLTDRDVKLEFISLLYDKVLADQVRSYFRNSVRK